MSENEARSTSGAVLPTTAPMREPKPALYRGAVYIADNGRVICVECAGQSAKYTGRDLSGERVQRVSLADLAEWENLTGEPTMTCEAGCTSIRGAAQHALLDRAREVR